MQNYLLGLIDYRMMPYAEVDEIPRPVESQNNEANQN